MSHTPPSAWALAYACGLWLAVAVTFPAVLLVAREDERNTARQSAVHADLRRYCDLLTAGDNAYVGTRQREYLLHELASPLVQSRFWTVTHQIALANDYLRFGETEQAVATLERALEQTGAGEAERNRRAKLLEALAVAHLKQGELANCLTPSGGLVCALPLDPSYVHGDRHGSTRAIARLRELLAIEPDNLKARWLLNVAHMTLGGYPDRVDPAYLVPRELLDPGIPFQRFADVAPAAGLYRIDLAGGAVMDDFDNDGLLDVMSSSWHPCEPVSYYRNLGDGTFADHTERAGLAGQTGGLNMVQADYDNDGLTDVLIMRGGWLLEDGQMRMSLLRNTGGGFEDVTREAGLGPPDYPSQSAAWADYDGDGDLDLFSCNESMPETGGGMKYPSQLYRNDGGTFHRRGGVRGRDQPSLLQRQRVGRLQRRRRARPVRFQLRPSQPPVPQRRRTGASWTWPRSSASRSRSGVSPPGSGTTTMMGGSTCSSRATARTSPTSPPTTWVCRTRGRVPGCTATTDRAASPT